MFVHLAVPVSSYSAFPSRLTSTFVTFMLLGTAVILRTTQLLYREKLERCGFFSRRTPSIQTQFKGEMRNFIGQFLHAPEATLLT